MNDFKVGDLVECIDEVLLANEIGEVSYCNRKDLAVVLELVCIYSIRVCLQKNNAREIVPRWRWEVVE